MIVIDFNQIARIAKLVALLGFFLPWVTVSCSGTDILTATGLQLMTGDPQPAGPLAGMSDSETSMEDAEPSVLVVAAFGAVLIGLVCGLLTRAQTAATTMLAAAVLGLALTYFSVENMRSEMRREIEQSQSEQSGLGAQVNASVASSIEVEKEEGYWLTLGGLGAAALFALLTLVSRRREDATAPS